MSQRKKPQSIVRHGSLSSGASMSEMMDIFRQLEQQDLVTIKVSRMMLRFVEKMASDAKFRAKVIKLI